MRTGNLGLGHGPLTEETPLQLEAHWVDEAHDRTGGAGDQTPSGKPDKVFRLTGDLTTVAKVVVDGAGGYRWMWPYTGLNWNMIRDGDLFFLEPATGMPADLTVTATAGIGETWTGPILPAVVVPPPVEMVPKSQYDAAVLRAEAAEGLAEARLQAIRELNVIIQRMLGG